MAGTLAPYICAIRSTLQAALCLQSFPCQMVERQSKPEVEAQEHPELLLEPLLICRNAAERCLVEGSVNSVRVSLKVKQVDALDEIIAANFLRFLMQRADSFGILRKAPIEGYDISFLITNAHTESMYKDKLVDFICDFISDIDSEISELKLSINARGRAVGAELLRSLAA
mmetsp:Transcript_21616/g.60089  ORF Transcript_21616/g.60089 Transcript_21616/m.60089 type:complete len:171 (-) Transcript_21616:58-570(-)